MSDAVLVTGATGFIGKPLSGRLEQAGYAVIRHSRDDGDIATCALPGAVNGNPVNHVYHLAARTFVPDSWTDPRPFYATNVLGTVNVAEFCRRHNASLTMLSSYVYGRPQSVSVTEEHPVAAHNPYSHTKLLAEDVCRYYARHFGIPVTVVRPFNIFGPGQAESFLLPTLLKQALDPDVREISVADDRPKRDYLFLDDLLDLLLLTVQPHGFDTVNAGSGRSFSPREVADAILRIAGIEKPVVSRNEVRADEVLDTIADIGKAKRIFSWQPRVSRVEGLRRMLEEAPGAIGRAGGPHR